jgi:hypothetical protein
VDDNALAEKKGGVLWRTMPEKSSLGRAAQKIILVMANAVANDIIGMGSVWMPKDGLSSVASNVKLTGLIFMPHGSMSKDID